MAYIDKITTQFWFDTQAEEAANFYTSIFKNSKIGDISYYTKAGQEIHKQKPGSVMTVEFTLEDQSFLALNGGPLFKFNESISFIINCDTQEEVDYYWEKLNKGGDTKSQQCGWLKDEFGVSWQVVPTVLHKMLKDQDKEKAERAMASMMQMKKLIISELEDAFNG